MAERRVSDNSPTPRRIAAVLAAVVAVCVAILFASYLLHKERPVAGTPSPRALFNATLFTIPAHGSACQSSATLPPDGRILQLQLGEGTGSPHGSPPIDALLSAPGYRELAHLAGEQPEGETQLPIHPPRHYVIGSVCLINRGFTPAALAGSTEPRSISRSKLTINGRPTAGDIAITFLNSHKRTRLSRLGEVFGHASNLTDHLIPVWFVWILTVIALLAVPVATAAMFGRAIREDEAQ
jgi:hypothetical protein